MAEEAQEFDRQKMLRLAQAQQARLRLEAMPEPEPLPEKKTFGEMGKAALNTAGKVAGELNQGLILNYLPQSVQEKFHNVGIGSVPGNNIEGPIGKGLQYAGMALPMAAGIPAYGATLPQAGKYPGIFRGLIDDITAFAQKSPGMYYGGEAGAAFGAGALGEVARENNAGPVGQLTSELIGGMGGGMVTAVPRGLQAGRQAFMRNLAPMTEEGGSIRAAQQTQARAGGREQAEAYAATLETTPQGVTPAQWIGDERLMAQEARLLADNPQLSNQVKADLQQARVVAQESLLDSFGKPRTKQEWELSVLDRVVPEGTIIEAGMTDDMLDQAYNSFKPVYDTAKGYQIEIPTITYERPLTFSRGGNLMEQPPVTEPAFMRNLVGAVKSDDIIADPQTRNQVSSWVANQTKEVQDEIVNGTLDSEKLLSLRSKFRDERRRQTKNGNLERADLLGAAESELTTILNNGLPEDVVQILNDTDSQYRVYKVVEDAIFNAGDSPLTPQQLSNAIRSGGLTSNSKYARGVDQVTQQMRNLALAGRSTEEVLGNPRSAEFFVRGLSDIEKQAVHADFVNVLYNRARDKSMDATGGGYRFISGSQLMQDIAENKAVMRNLGMTKQDINRLEGIAGTVQKLEKRSPAAVTQLFEDGPASLIELAAAIAGAKSGQNMAGGGIGSSLVLASYMSNRARRILAGLTSDQAEKLLEDAVTDPKLYDALLTRSVVNRNLKENAAYLDSWLLASAYNNGQEMAQEDEQ